MSRAHVLIALGLLLVNGSCSSAQPPPQNAASSRVSARVEAGPREGTTHSSQHFARLVPPPALEWTPEPLAERSQPLEGSQPLLETDAAPQTLVEAIVACRRVQNDRELPVGCRTEFVDDVPTLVLGFASAADAAEYASAMDAQLSVPFCEAAHRAGRTAALFALVADSARQFDCELQEWGVWFELSANSGHVSER